MPIPNYQKLLLPLLRLADNGRAKTLIEAEILLADELVLTDDERASRLPSSQQTVLRNRTGWASFYLKKAGLLDKPRRGVFYITERGKELLAEAPDDLTLQDLLKFPEFKDFYQNRAVDTTAEDAAKASIPPREAETPDEVLQAAYRNIRLELANELLDRLLQVSPESFENIVVELLVAMGYGGSRKDAGERIGKSGDGGIDGIIKEDKLGLDTIFIQAKRWQGNVGRPEIQKFVGALQGQRARKGVFMTTSRFSADAIEYASHIDTKVVLLDGIRIAELMIDHDVGVSHVAAFVVKKIDSDYFDEL
jgi:restriction system protein